MPIFLTTGTTLDTATAEAMKSCGIKRVLVIGGPKAIRPAVLEEAEDAAGTAIRIYGADAIATSKAVASWGLNNGMGKATFGVATASGYKDALCGAALCGKGNAVLVLTSPSNTSGMSAIGKTIASKNKSVYVFGGTKAVNLAEELVLDKSLAGTTAYTTR